MNRLEQMRAAIRRLEAAGAKPTGRAVGYEIGGFVDADFGLNGRDGKTWAEAMLAEGYVRQHYGPNGLGIRWVKP